MSEYLFSYGTLQNEDVQLRLFGRLLTGSSDVLKGYRASVIEITDETFLAQGAQKHQLSAAVSDDETDSLKGTVFEISGKELALSDEYEPDAYERIAVNLESGLSAWLYLKRIKL